MSDPVHERFLAYSSFGDKNSAGQIDNNMFSKLCKECGIVNKQVTTTDVDITFAKVKPKGLRKLDWAGFNEALALLAQKRFPSANKETSLSQLKALISSSKGPQANATKADFVKFHDDKSTYTGVYAKGGPTNVDNTITLSNLLDRSSADARGVKNNK